MDLRPCLDDHELLALLEARLSLAARAAALGHLDLCHACLQIVAALAAGRRRPMIRPNG